jgi:hypothetical protein
LPDSVVMRRPSFGQLWLHDISGSRMNADIFRRIRRGISSFPFLTSGRVYRQPSVDLPNRIEDRNRSDQLTEGNNSDTMPVNPDGPVGSTNDTQIVVLGGGHLLPPLA